MNIGFVYAIGAAITWGLVYSLDQKILTFTSPATLLFIDSIITAIAVLPFVFFSHGSIRTLLSSGKVNLSIVILSLLLAVLANFLIYSGIQHVGASEASVIEIMYPFFVVLFSYVLFRNSPNLYFFLGGVLVFIGSVIIIKFS